MMPFLRESFANEKRIQAEAEKKENCPKFAIKARPTSSRHNLSEKGKTMKSAPFSVPSTPLNRTSSVTRSSSVLSRISTRSVPVTAPRFAAIPSSIPESESALEKLDDDDRKHLHEVVFQPYHRQTKGLAYRSSANNTPYQHHQGHVYRSSANNTPYHPQASDDKDINDNLYFYMNMIKSKPSPGYLIEEMLKWKGDYRTLEVNDSYIQWLFPNFDSSAKPLRRHEAMAIAQIPELRDRFVRAYKMMLHFYGMELKSTKTGEIQRCEENWRDRFRHLNTTQHNHFRITRILHSLAAFGFQKYQEPLILFVMENENVLPRLQGETLAYWWNTIPSEDSWLYGLNYQFSESGDVNESSFDEENCKNNTSDHVNQRNLLGILNKVDSSSSAPDKDCPLDQQQLIQQQQQNQQHHHIQQPNDQQWQDYRPPRSVHFQKDPQNREIGCTWALFDDM